MSPKTRFQILLEPEQLDALRKIQERTDAPVAAQVRRAVDEWIRKNGEKAERPRVAARKRS